VDQRSGPAGEHSVAAPFLNRRRELQTISDALARTLDGRGGLVLVTGEAGIGKTRLVEQLIATAPGAQETSVVWGRCWDSGGAPSMWPWIGVLRGLFADRDPGELRSELGPAASWLAQLVPELRKALPELEEEAVPDSEQSRFVLFDALAQFLRRASSERALLILLDDIHAADRLSLLALLFLARQLGDMRVLVIATWRGFDELREPELAALLTKLSRLAEPVALTGLGPDDVGRLIAHRQPSAADREIADTLHRATGGNPFFADEVVRMLVADGSLDAPGAQVQALPLPSGVRALIEQRLEALPEATVEVLRSAAVIGQRFALATLAHARGCPRDELQEQLEPALEAHLIEELRDEVASLRFAHDLIRETAYAGLRPVDRARAHAAVGAALADRYAGVTDLHVDELAHHFLAALPGGEPATAVALATRAGDRALGAFAHERAQQLYAAALGALELVDGLDGTERARLRTDLLLGLGRARQSSAEPRARATLLEAAAVARLLESPAPLAEVAHAFGSFALSPGRVDGELTGLVEEALARLEPDDGPARVRLLSRLARALYWSPDGARRLALVDEAVAIARRLGDPAVLAVALGSRIQSGRGPDTGKHELELIDEFMSLPSPPGELVVVARSVEIDLLLERGVLAAADAAIDAMERQADRLRDIRARPYVPVHRARRAMMEGRWADTERYLDEAGAIAADLEDSTFPLTIGGGRFVLELTRSRPEQLEDGLRTLAQSLPNMPVWQSGLALIAAHGGEHDEARLLLDRLAARELAGIPRDIMWMITVALLAQTCALVADGERARLLYDALLPFAPLSVISPLSGHMGPVARHLGVLADTFGDAGAAERHLRDALGLARTQRTPPMISLIAVDLARVLARNGSASQEASTLLGEARRLADELDTPVVAERAAAVAAELPSSRAAVRASGSTERVAAMLSLDGEVWSFELQGRIVRIRDSKGVRHLSELLSRPGVELHSLDLVRGAPLAAADDSVAAHAAVVAGELSVAGAGAGPSLDATAKSAYRRRLEDLREQLEEAERFNDPERAARAREEIDFLARELASAVGLGGRDRPQGSDAERARVNATRAIRTAIRRISDQDASLGAELAATIRTGLFCSYVPDPRRLVSWEVDGG
jgi:hypothetical protein